MRLFDECRPGTLADVSYLRRAVGRELQNLRIPFDLANEVLLAIAEIATNAVGHGTPAPSEIGLTIDLVGASLRIEITDNGGAFADFERLWKAARVKDIVASGTSGLGLSLTQAILRDVTYTPGSPNRLVGWRPLRRQRPAILILEDDPTLLRLYGMVLKDRYRIYSATSVEDALLIASTSTIDLILSDYHVGEEVGTGLLKELERDAERLPVPVVMMSADRNLTTRASADRFGIEEFLLKPVSPAALSAAVAQALAKSSRRLTGLFRYFGASVERLLAPPVADDLKQLGGALRQANATVGGGDFLLHLKAQHRDRFVLADVMGHGLQAKAGAIAHAASMRAIHAATDAAAGPGAFLATLSQLMRRDPALSETILTVIVADRLADGTLEVASAAHPAPVVVSRSGAAAIDVGGPLLGLFDGAAYQTARIAPREGARLALVTDGVEPRHLAGGGDLPGALVERLQASLASPVDAAADDAAAWVLSTHGPSPGDDWTIMLLELAGPRP